MYFFSRKILATVFIFLFASSLFNAAAAQDQPLLSEAIRNAIDVNGVEAAKQQFASMDPSEREQYNVDMEGISELTNAYLKNGNMEALIAISEISAPFMQDLVAQSMEQYAPEMEGMEEMAEQREAERDQKARQREELKTDERERTVIERQGQPRDDLDRFTGVYGDPEAENSTRQLWVNVSCDGYLVSGAMWGDAAPWWMRSESDNIFTFENAYSNIRMEFTTGAGGSHLEMTHNLELMESPLQWVGPLPKGWDSCMERYR